MSDWEGLTTRRGNVPRFVGGRRGRPIGSRKVMPKTRKDAEQDKKIQNVQRHVKKIIRMEELNHVDTIISGVALGSDPGVAQTILLNGLVQGDTNITRNADETMFTSLQLRGYVVSDTDQVNGIICRVIVFWDKHPNGVAPTAANLLDNSVITLLVNSPYNSDFYKRFKILYDRRFTLNPNSAATTTPASGVVAATVPITVPFEHRKQFNRQSNYGLGNAGTIADIARGACYILLLSSTTVAGGTAPLMNAGIRMIFKDL